MFTFIFILAIIAAIILLIVYINQPRSEWGFRENFNEFIAEELQQNYNIKEVREVNLTEPINLDSKHQLIVFGINHADTIRSPWAIYLVTAKNDPRLIRPTFGDIFWISRFSRQPEKDAIKIEEPFEVQELIWTEKEVITARGFLVPINFSKRSVRFYH